MKTAETPWYTSDSSVKNQLTNTFSIMHQKEHLFYKLNQDLTDVYESIRLFKQLSHNNNEIEYSLDPSKILFEMTEQSGDIGGNYGPNNL